MAKTVADQFAETLAVAGVKRVYGIVGDSLNGLTDSIRRQDDIQGTAAIVLAGLTTALQMLDAPLRQQRILLLGAGSAGLGIAKRVAAAMQMKGLAQADRKRDFRAWIEGYLYQPGY